MAVAPQDAKGRREDRGILSFRLKARVGRPERRSEPSAAAQGEPLGRRRLDPSGVGMLKQLSYQAFCTAMRFPDNDFRKYFDESLQRTNDRTHARLSTQRKILTVLWAMWKKGEDYRPCGAGEDGGDGLLRKDGADGQSIIARA